MAETSKPNGSGGEDRNAIIGEIRALEGSIMLQRYQFARMAGMSFGGARDEYQTLGYDRQITTRQYRDEYERGGIAGRIVDAMPNATWRGMVELIEDEDPDKITPFEQAWMDLDQKHQIQAKLLRADKLAGLSSYAVLLIGAKGNGDLSTELSKGKPEGLLYLTPFGGGGGPGTSGGSRVMASDSDASIFEFDTDPQSERFGLPKSYQLRRLDVASPLNPKPVHWTRVIHVAENLLDDEVYGQPALERVWNLLADLRKVTGGGAEAFWLRANQGLHLDVDKDMPVADLQKTLDALKVQSEEYKHQITRWLRTRGVKASVLGSDVANFSNPTDAILTQIAGSKAIPKRILTGSEMGELASSQDRDNWKDQVNGRQTGYAGPYIIRPLVDRLIEYGYLPSPKAGPDQYEVRWPHIQTMTEQEKTAGAQSWATVNQTYGQVVFTDSEIREKWADKAPLSDEQKAEIDEAEKQKAERAQAMLPPQPEPEDQDEEDDEDDEEEAAGKQRLKAAEAIADDEELIRVLAAAIESGAVEVIEAICGMRHAHLPGQHEQQSHGGDGGGEDPSDFGGLHRIRLKDDETGQIESPMLTSAAQSLNWMKQHPEVKSWRVKGTIAAQLGSAWRKEGKTTNRYFEESFTPAQLEEHLRLSGHLKIREAMRHAGDLPGHPFHGNQWTQGQQGPADAGGGGGSDHPLLYQRFKTGRDAEKAARKVTLETGRATETYFSQAEPAGRKYSIGFVPGKSEQSRLPGESDDEYLKRIIGL